MGFASVLFVSGNTGSLGGVAVEHSQFVLPSSFVWQHESASSGVPQQQPLVALSMVSQQQFWKTESEHGQSANAETGRQSSRMIRTTVVQRRANMT